MIVNDVVRDKVKAFIAENFLFRSSFDLDESASLIEAGYIDSTAVLELVSFLETEFGISVADADIVPDNLDSIASIARYVGSRQAQKAA
jgi:acyl carrier protein